MKLINSLTALGFSNQTYMAALLETFSYMTKNKVVEIKCVFEDFLGKNKPFSCWSVGSVSVSQEIPEAASGAGCSWFAISSLKLQLWAVEKRDAPTLQTQSSATRMHCTADYIDLSRSSQWSGDSGTTCWCLRLLSGPPGLWCSCTSSHVKGFFFNMTSLSSLESRG